MLAGLAGESGTVVTTHTATGSDPDMVIGRRLPRGYPMTGIAGFGGRNVAGGFSLRLHAVVASVARA